MCFDSKSSITSSWIICLLSLFIWYRNQKYDRVFSVFIFTLGLIQLIEFGIHNASDPYQSGKAIFITLWLQCLVLAIGLYVFFKSMSKERKNCSRFNYIKNISLINLIFFSIIFIFALFFIFYNEKDFYASVGKSGYIEWYYKNGNILGYFGIFYLLGLIIPLILLLAFYDWSDITIYLFLLYLFFSAVYIFYNYPINAFGSMWCYLSVGFAFLVWFLGIIPSHKYRNSL